MDTLKIEKVLVTPEVAKLYLTTNTMNRQIDQLLILKYATEMLTGRWGENTGEMISFTKSGILADGQHRLLAVIKTGKPCYFHIVTGVDEEAIHVINTGKNRSSYASFKIKGIKNESVLPSIINAYLSLKNNSVSMYRLGRGQSTLNLLNIYNDKPEFWQVVASRSTSWNRSFSKILSAPLIGGIYAFLFDIDAGDAYIFMDQLCTGIGIENTTINILRDKLTVDKLSLTKKMPFISKISIIIKCWNCYRSDIIKKSLKYDAINEQMPVAA